MLKQYECLTNAAPAPNADPPFSFRAGDKIELDDDEAKILLDAGAIKPVGTSLPDEVVPRRASNKAGRDRE